MATDIPVQKFGEAPNYIAATSEMTYSNDGRTVLKVRQFSGGDLVLTHVEQKQCNFGHALQDEVDTIPTGTETDVWRGWQLRRFNETGTHKAHVLFDVTSGVTVAAISNAK